MTMNDNLRRSCANCRNLNTLFVFFNKEKLEAPGFLTCGVPDEFPLCNQ